MANKLNITKDKIVLPHFATKENIHGCDCGYVFTEHEATCLATFHFKRDNHIMQSEHVELNEAIANSKLYVDAHNTYLNNHILPSELLQQMNDLIDVFNRVLEREFNPCVVQDLKKLIEKITQ